MPRLALAALVLLVALGRELADPASTAAQAGAGQYGPPRGAAPVSTGAPAGYYVTPSLTVSESWDDNVLNSQSRGGRQRAAREDDFVTLLRPGLRLGYQSEPLTLLGSYSTDFQYFLKHPELNNEARQFRGALNFRWQPERLGGWTFTTNASATRSEEPSEIDELAGLEGGRRLSTAYAVEPAVTYQFSQRTSGTFGLTWGRTEAEGTTNTRYGASLRFQDIVLRPEDTTADAFYRYSIFEAEQGAVTTRSTRHALDTALKYVVRPQDTVSLLNDFSYLDREDAGTTISHSVRLGWTHRFSETATAGVEAGVRITDGEISPDFRLFADTAFGPTQGLRITVSSDSEVRQVAGQGDLVRTQSYSASISYQPPIQYLQFSVSGTVTDVSREGGSGGDALVYSLRASATYTYPLTTWLSAFASYNFSYRERDEELFLPPGGQEIVRNVVSIGLNVVYPYRIY